MKGNLNVNRNIFVKGNRLLPVLYLMLAAFTVLMSWDHASRIVYGVSDDITHVKTLQDFQNGLMSTKDLFLHYLTEPARQQRPLSGLFIATHTYLGQQSVFAFYFIRFIYVAIFMMSFRFLLKQETKDELLIFLLLFLSTIYPLGSGVYFIVIMWQMYWVFTFYFLHLALLYKKSPYLHLLSGMMFLVCLLFNEYVVFLTPFVLYLIFFRIQNPHKLRKLLLSVALPFILVFVYRYFLVDRIYGNTYKFDDATFAPTVQNFIRYIATTIKFFSVYNLNLVFKAFRNIQYYNLADVILLFLSMVICILLTRSPLFVRNFSIRRRDIFLAFLFYLLTFSFCAFTFYKPYVNGFNTRIFSLGLFVFPVVTVVFFFYIRKITARKIFFILFTFICSVTVVSQKNGWIYASQLNEKMVKKSKIESIDLRKSKTLLISWDQSRYPGFVIDEPSATHLAPFYHLEHSGLPAISVDEIILKPHNSSLLGFEYDHFQPNFYYLDETKIRVRNRPFSYPFYIYQFESDKLNFIENQQQLENYQKQYQQKLTK